MNDAELLQQYVRDRSQAAFAQLVRRHIDWIYSVARRQVGDAHLAEDVTQATFVVLMNHAPSLAQREDLTGWLFKVTRYGSADAVKKRTRRIRHEQEAALMTSARHGGRDPQQETWEQIAPLLDDAVARLGQKDREAILLRFFRGCSHAEVARMLGTSEAAARKRVSRAVEKLRHQLAEAGATLPAGALAGVLATQATQAAPAGLIASTCGMATAAGPAMAGASVLSLAKGVTIMTAATKAKLAAVVAAVVIILGMAAVVVQQGIAPNAARPQAGDAIAGVVTDPLGRPRANVFLSPLWPGEVASGIQSDDHGRFELSGRARGRWAAWSQATRTMGLFSIDAPGDLHVELPYDQADLTGRLVDEQGRGVARRTVEVAVTTPDGTRFISTPLESDQSGYYDMPLLPAGEGLSVQVRAANPRGAMGPWSLATDLQPNQIALELPDLLVDGEGTDQPARLRLGGQVRDEQGQPVAGARVYLSYRLDSRQMVTRSASARTNENGHWRRRVPPEAYHVSLTAEHPEFVRGRESPAMEHLRDGTAVTVLKRGLEVRGVVRDEHGRPVDDALVLTEMTISSTAGIGEPIEDATMARGTPDGRFRVGALTAGPRELAVYAPGFAPRVVSVDVQPGMQPVEIALERGGRIHGRVVDAAGAPVDGVRVTAGQWRVPRGQYPLPRGTFSDADGRFELRELPLEGNTSLSFNKRGNYMFTRLSDVEPREEPYELTLHAPTRIDGQVVDDETGEPISRFELVQGMQGRGSELVFADRGRRTVNSATGSFSQQAQRVMASPPYPKMAVRVRANGYLPAETEAVPVGERLEGVVIRLKRGEPITGRATTPQGEPARDAEVAWVGPARTAFIRDGRLTEMYTHAAEVVERTDRQGRFRLPASAEPGVIVVVHASGYRVLSHETLLEEEGQVPLLSWARIEGRTGFDIPPGDQVAVTARLVEEPPLEERPPVSWIFHTHAQPDARFLMEHVPAEPMVIYLADGGGAAEVTPRAGETSTVRIGRAPTPHTPPAQ